MPRNRENEELLKSGKRRCSSCEKVMTVDRFHRRSDIPSGRSSRCKRCCGVKVGYSEDQLSRTAERKTLADLGKRRCYTCSRIKSFDEFSKDPSAGDGMKVHCKPCHAKYMKVRHAKWRHSLRKEALFKYGGKCGCCGEDRYEFLAIDHKNGGGNKHRNSGEFHPGLGFLMWLKKNSWPKDFRVLCHNCNSAMGYYGYCPHKSRRANDFGKSC